jgi:hypothetical protein
MQNARPANTALRCTEFKPLVRNTLRGFAEISVAELRLTIKDVAVHRKGERCWAQLPAKPFVKDGMLVKGDDGRIQYFPILSFDTRAVADAFSAAVVHAVRRLVPEAFDDVRGAS